MKKLFSTLMSLARGPVAADASISPTPVADDQQAARNPSRKSRDTTEYKVGEEIAGVVTGIEHYGLFVRLPNGESGLVFHNEICWPGQEITYGLGHRVKVLVVGFKPGRGLSLSIRDTLTQEAFEQFSKMHAPNSVICGQVKSVLDYGIFVILAPGVDGLLHVSTIPDIHVYGKSSIGEPIDVRVTSIDPETNRIALELCS